MIETIKERFAFYDSITDMSNILRRYFVINSFDGALTIFGLILGSYISGVEDSRLLIFIGISTSIAIGFSGLTGAFLTEKAERDRELKEMEIALNRNLDNTDYKKAYDYATILAGFVNGISPVVTSLILLFPFFFFSSDTAYPLSIIISISLFFFLGAFLGKISKENLIFTGLKLVLAGLACMGVIFIFGNI